MIDALPLFHCIAGRPVIVLGEGEAAQAKRRLVERAGGIVVSDTDVDARIAFVALPEPEAAAARLRDRGVLVNVPDRPELCDFTTPAILDRSPVLVAIGTGGASAGLAKALRLRLEALLPLALGRLALALGEAREAMRELWPDPGARRRALDTAMAAGGPLDPLRADGNARVTAWLAGASGAEGEGGTGDIAEIRLASDDPDDLTLRQARLLGSADWLAHEPAVPDAVLDRARADAPRIVLAAGRAVPQRRGLTVVLRR